ncbi:MAG: DUF202 domain-containing protein, partial [Tannerellaceae bacterium]|nr:DUF202 domain-containing protein [Tannerellaceae bacterium]
ALERTRLANERTLFSYIRTSLYLLTVGVGILQIDTVNHLRTLAWVSVGVSILILGMGIIRFMQLKKQLRLYIEQDKFSK